ncbi:MAG: hypothetical protein JSR99_06660 [Proteobacteria bacterium]|nr:hypothetical protein [Pseudomonadota bacterium]
MDANVSTFAVRTGISLINCPEDYLKMREKRRAVARYSVSKKHVFTPKAFDFSQSPYYVE